MLNQRNSCLPLQRRQFTQLTQGGSKVRRACQSIIGGVACTELHHSDRTLRTAWFKKNTRGICIIKGWMSTLPTHIYVTTCKVNFASDDPFKMKHTTQFTDVWAHQITGICAIIEFALLLVGYAGHYGNDLVSSVFFIVCIVSKSPHPLVVLWNCIMFGKSGPQYYINVKKIQIRVKSALWVSVMITHFHLNSLGTVGADSWGMFLLETCI